MRTAVEIKLGSRYGMLLVRGTGFVKRTNISFPTTTRRYSVCKCDCGNITDVDNSNLKAGRSRSCGCNQGMRGKIKNIIVTKKI